MTEMQRQNAAPETIREAARLSVSRPEDRTAAELRKISGYEPGIEIRFSRDYRSLGVKSGDVATVSLVDAESGTVRLEMPGGTLRDFAPHRLSGKGWELGRTQSLEFSPGDRIRITGNALKKEGVTNGMKGEVREASEMCLRVRLDNGRDAVLPVGRAPLEVDHGYAQTGSPRGWRPGG